LVAHIDGGRHRIACNPYGPKENEANTRKNGCDAGNIQPEIGNLALCAEYLHEMTISQGKIAVNVLVKSAEIYLEQHKGGKI